MKENIMHRNIIWKSIIAGLLTVIAIMPAAVSHAAVHCANKACVVGTATLVGENQTGQTEDGWIVLQDWQHKQPAKKTYRVDGHVLKVMVDGKESKIRLPEYMKNAQQVKLVNEKNDLFVEYHGDNIVRLWCGRFMKYRDVKGQQTTAYFVPFYRIKDNEQVKNRYLAESVNDDVVAEMAGYKPVSNE